jgi:hypothetical protein
MSHQPANTTSAHPERDARDAETRARARFWVARAGGFLLTVLGLCALGGLLGGIVFPIVGRIGGARSAYEEMVVAGVKSGAFIFMVWAPGVALVREFMRGAKARKRRGEAGSSARE